MKRFAQGPCFSKIVRHQSGQKELAGTQTVCSTTMGSSFAVIEGPRLHGFPKLLMILMALGFYSLSRFSEAIPIVPSHLLTDNCTTANVEYYSEQPPGSFFYYTGTPDSYCYNRPTPTAGWKICGANSAPSCTTVIAPYGSKTDACKAASSSYTCRSSVRVFFINYDLDCDWVIICEYFDGPVVATTGTTAPSIVAAPPMKGTAGAPLLAPPIVSAEAPAPLLPPSPSLLPKAGDVVILLSYAAGSVDYYCNKGETFLTCCTGTDCVRR